MNDLTIHHPTFTPAITNPSVANVWKWFAGYQVERGLSMARPDLQGFVDWQLAQGKKPSTVATYLNHLRGVYKRLLTDNTFHEWVIGQASGNTLAEKIIVGNQILASIKNILVGVRVEVVKIQDRDDRARRWLNDEEQEMLLYFAVYEDSPIVYRDSALIQLMLSTGIRAAEVVALQVADLRGYYDGHLALVVRAGKGNKQRLIPYGNAVKVVERVEDWLAMAGITDGPIFRRILKNGAVGSALNEKTITDYILPQYPIWLESEQAYVTIKAHDLRRSYARTQYERGMSLEALRANLGHSDLKTTLHYIGKLDGAYRAGK